jgi:acetyl esterase/lipase
VRAFVAALAVLAFASLSATAQDKQATPKKVAEKTPPTPPIPPTAANYRYGLHERQVFDFWQAKAEAPTPLVLLIHGGGWRNGDKSGYYRAVKAYLDKGISVAALNYRFVQHGVEQHIQPPVKAPVDDAARALQTLRARAKEWNLDKARVGATGGSAGACTSLWLAFHDDLADPSSSDPVARESTRLACVAVSGAQVSLDPKELREWIPNYGYGAHAFGLKTFQELYDQRDRVLGWILEYSPIAHVSPDDPPVFLEYNQQKPPVVGEKQHDPTHSAVMDLKLEEKLKANGVECILVYPGHPHPQYKNSSEFLIDRLRK